MISIKSLIILCSILSIGLSQINDNIKRDRDGVILANDAKVGGRAVEKRASISLNFLMDGKQDCPLQDLGSKLLNDAINCDIELEVYDLLQNESRLFCAHKSILSLRSTVLDQRIKELLKSNIRHERPRLRLSGLNPDIFQYILQYIYTDKIDQNFDLKRYVMDLYVAADYVKLAKLNAMIREYLYYSANINDVSNYLRWANRYGHKKIKYLLLDITRTALKMNRNEWRQFVKTMCQSLPKGEIEEQVEVWFGTIVEPVGVEQFIKK